MDNPQASTDRVYAPTADRVLAACEQFDQDERAVEWVLTQLFQEFPKNTDFDEVVVKTKVLNTLYNTRILAVDKVARHIWSLAIDADLKAGEAEIVDRIAKVQLSDKIHNFFVFASKYCSWHYPTKYPIYDSNVEACLWCYRKQDSFDKFTRWGFDYPEFKRRVNAFRDFYGLTSFTYKQLDKLLCSLGETLLSRGKT